MDPILKLEGIFKRYGALEVLSGFDLSVEAGECVGLLGPNGAGKTTTMKTLTGQVEVDDGVIEVLGLPLPRHSRRVRQMLGVVTQDDTLDEELDCLQNLIVHASFFGVPWSVARHRAETLLDFVQLRDRADARVTSLSGGMRRRLLIARALVNDPQVVLLDEPTTGLDPQSRQNVWTKVRELKRQGTTVLLTTHYMDEAEQLCDRLVILDRGHVVARGQPRKLIEAHVGKEVIELRSETSTPEQLRTELPLGDLAREVFSDTLFVFLRDGEHAPHELWDVEGVESFHRRATLEDVFLRQTGRELRDE